VTIAGIVHTVYMGIGAYQLHCKLQPQTYIMNLTKKVEMPINGCRPSNNQKKKIFSLELQFYISKVTEVESPKL